MLSGWPHLWFSCCLVFENLLSSFLQSCPVLKLLLQAALETSRNQKKVSKIKKNIENSKETIQNQKNIEKSKDFVQNRKKPREIEKNQKNQSGQQNVYMIPEHCPRIFGFFGFFRFLEVFFGFGQNLSISRCFFRFWDRSLTSARGVRWRTVCMIPAHCPRIFRLFFFGFGQEPDICKGGVRWRTVCMIPAHCPRIIFSSVLARMQQN